MAQCLLTSALLEHTQRPESECGRDLDRERTAPDQSRPNERFVSYEGRSFNQHGATFVRAANHCTFS